MPGVDLAGTPLLAFVFFQMMFAVVTPALITGAVVERWRFGAFVAFTALWSVLVYAPVTHGVFSPLGWASHQGALDFAGDAASAGHDFDQGLGDLFDNRVAPATSSTTCCWAAWSSRSRSSAAP